MKAQVTSGTLMLGAICMAALGEAQTPAQDVTAVMQGELSAQVQEGCSSELAQYCAEVTPGEGRLLACLYAHGDKLSGQCDYALYDAAARTRAGGRRGHLYRHRMPQGTRHVLREGRSG